MRHQTLEATIAWSHDLLGPDERALLRCLSVFAGSFSLEAAETVGQASAAMKADVMDVLTNLVERSFVIREGTSGTGAVSTARDHARVRAAAAPRGGRGGGGQERAPRLLRGLCRFTEVDVAHPDVASRLAWLDELDLEADNIRAALRNCLADPDGADLGLTMAAGLGQYWRNRAVTEGAHWIDALLDRRGDDDAIRSEALFVKIDLAVVKGDHAAGLDAAAEAGAIARRLKADALLVRILANQAALQVLGGDLSAARATSADATALAARLGDDMSFITAAQSDAFIAFLDGDFVRMRDVGLAAASRCRRSNEVFILPVHLTSAGMAALMLGEFAVAEAALVDALRASIVIDDRPGLVLRMEMLASSAAMAGRAQRAAELLGACEMLRGRIGAELSPFTRPLVEKAQEQAQAALGEARFKKAFDAGAHLDRDGAVGLAIGHEGGSRSRPDARQNRSTARQTRTRGRGADRRGLEQQGDRVSTIPVRAHRRDPRLQHPQQARSELQGQHRLLGDCQVAVCPRTRVISRRRPGGRRARLTRRRADSRLAASMRQTSRPSSRLWPARIVRVAIVDSGIRVMAASSIRTARSSSSSLASAMWTSIK